MLALESITPWAPHPSAAPRTLRDGKALVTAANGTRTCVGGWQFVYTGVTPGQTYAFEGQALVEGFEHPRDHLKCVAHWEAMSADQPRSTRRWGYLLPQMVSPDEMHFTRALTAPQGATHLTLRYTFRWTTEGQAIWSLPRIEEAPAVWG